MLTEFLSKRPKNSFPPDFCDLWFLYKTVRIRKPRIVLEFGSGCFTVVLAKALYDNASSVDAHPGFLYSIDADPSWATSTINSLPASLQKVCNITYGPALEIEYKGIPAFRHANVPDVIPNYVYLDGPALTPAREVAVDVLDLESRLPRDFFLVIDGRRKNTQFLRKHLKRNYSFQRRGIFDNSVFTLNG